MKTLIFCLCFCVSAVSPQNTSELLIRPKKLVKFKKFQEAINYLENDKANNENPDYWIILGIAYMGLNKYKLASSAFQKAISNENDSSVAFFNAACANALDNNPNAAFVFLDELNKKLGPPSKKRTTFFKKLKSDSNLKSLRKDSRYTVLLQHMRYGIAEKDFWQAETDLRAIKNSVNIGGDSGIRDLARNYSLEILNFSWRDSLALKNSRLGPASADFSWRVSFVHPVRNTSLSEMIPVVRRINILEEPVKIDLRNVTLWVGNQSNQNLKRVSLYKVLSEPLSFMSNPKNGGVEGQSLLAPNEHFGFMSTQAVVLPFNHQSDLRKTDLEVYSPQSIPGEPAVLFLVSTSEGSSFGLIENNENVGKKSEGQFVFFNKGNKKSSFSPFSKTNALIVVQIPLEQKSQKKKPTYLEKAFPENNFNENVSNNNAEDLFAADSPPVVSQPPVVQMTNPSKKLDDSFPELNGLTVKRDLKFEVRITVFYSVPSSKGQISVEDFRNVANKLKETELNPKSIFYSLAGSKSKPEEYYQLAVQSEQWWQDFFDGYLSSKGSTLSAIKTVLTQKLGSQFQKKPVSDLYLRDLLLP